MDGAHLSDCTVSVGGEERKGSLGLFIVLDLIIFTGINGKVAGCLKYNGRLSRELYN